jgi:phage terminase large subunit-like protein
MTVTTRASTYANRDNLAPAFLSRIVSRYEGTRQGRQELLGEMLEDNPGALWQGALIESARVKTAPVLSRIVVAVDPPASAGKMAAACGVIIAGISYAGHAYVLADRTVQGASPTAWARIVAASYHEFEADRVVAEVNQGGDLVAAVLRQVDPGLPITSVHATRGKALRAEPVAALYEQGRVHHVGMLSALEDAMTAFRPEEGALAEGQDRIDALVWALTHLMLAKPRPEPRIRRL